MRRREDGYHDLASLFHVSRGIQHQALRWAGQHAHPTAHSSQRMPQLQHHNQQAHAGLSSCMDEHLGKKEGCPLPLRAVQKPPRSTHNPAFLLNATLTSLVLGPGQLPTQPLDISVTAVLCMIMQVIDLGDDMDFELLPEGATKDTLVCSDPTIPSDDSNLVIKVREEGGGRA